MKRKITSIALSTVMTGSMLFTPVASAQDVTPNKIVVNENVQVQSTEEENLIDKVKEEAKIIKEEANVEEVEKEEVKKEEVKVEEVEKEEVKKEEVKVEEVEKEEVKKEEVKVEEVEKEEVKKEEVKVEEVEKEEVEVEEVKKEEAKLEKVLKKEVKLEEKSGLEFIKIKNSGKKSKNFNGIIEFFEENKETFKIDNAKDEFEIISKNTDKLGNTHIKLQQLYKGNPIYGKEYIVHFDEEGSIYAINGKIDNEIYNKVSKRTKRSLGIDQTMAVEAAKTEVEAEKLINEPEVKKYLYDLEGRYIPVYEVRLIVAEPELADWQVFVNERTGDIIRKSNKLATASVTGSGIGVLGDEKEINLNYNNDNYEMKDDVSSETSIVTYDATKVPTQWGDYWASLYLPGDLMVDRDNKFDANNQKAAVDAHKYANYVYHYYKDNFDRNSIDDRGMDIISSVHYGKRYSNAAWVGTQMIYGDGDGVEAAALSGSLDVVGHEITHGVTERTANLEYQDQSGALNESFSDVFGTLIEFEYQPEKADYLLGEDIWTPNNPNDALRDMANPGSDKAYRAQPAHMDDYINTTEDHGGVHTNSGIPNKAAYNVIQSIGHNKTGQIYYHALTNYLVKTSNFHDARLALIQSAKDLYGEDSNESRSVAESFDSVGVY
ncbi:M4 family metallopeptidase [Tepidibacter aestuarii]|uniref:M4 family metallopeptidase n=1 Tax=Tepidibacter aestuarii TaxID=2925782 RepID=UPI0020BF9F03|nr:M4 family metallopeptidase [Tepidibacter aestuarii]CAH2212355.1 extracellular neutral metalloprotease [Tepidibacter aestuarii]